MTMTTRNAIYLLAGAFAGFLSSAAAVQVLRGPHVAPFRADPVEVWQGKAGDLAYADRGHEMLPLRRDAIQAAHDFVMHHDDMPGRSVVQLGLEAYEGHLADLGRYPDAALARLVDIGERPLFRGVELSDELTRQYGEALEVAREMQADEAAVVLDCLAGVIDYAKASAELPRAYYDQVKARDEEWRAIVREAYLAGAQGR